MIPGYCAALRCVALRPRLASIAILAVDAMVVFAFRCGVVAWGIECARVCVAARGSSRLQPFVRSSADDDDSVPWWR